MSGLRPDQQIMASLVPRGSRVLDLGCGDGRLLRHLIDERDCQGTGVDSDLRVLAAATARGVSALDLDLDVDLPEFHDDSYDVVVCSRTLQSLSRPADVLTQMARIGDLLVVSMPNFGYWRHRLRLLGGRMPRSRDLPFDWHDTPNTRYATVHDLEEWFDALGLAALRRVSLGSGGHPGTLASLAPNLVASSTIHLLGSGSAPGPRQHP